VRKKLYLKSICFLLAVFMLLFLFGCGGSDTPAETGGDRQTEEQDSGTEDVEAKEEDSKGVVTLQVFSMPANKSGLMEGYWWTDILEEQVGVKLELLPSGDQGEQKLQALMASGELPDIVVFKTKKQVEDAVRANMLVCLDDHLDKLPNVVKNASTALQFYRDTASAGTGKAYAIPNSVGPGEVGAEINWGPFLRWDLYKELGMPEIETLEDYLPLLKQMQQLEPKNEDGQNVYGFTMWKDWDSITMHQACQASCIYGIDTGDQLGGALPFLQVDFNTNETKSILDPDSFYIRTLKFYFDANQMGLVDPDSLTQRFDTASQKVEQGRVLFAWWPWFAGNYNKPERVNADPPKGFRPVLPKDYKAFWWGDNPVGASWPFAIGSATEHLDACLRYVDFMYSTEGLMQLMNGPKGLTWDVDENGEPYITEEGWDFIENAKELPSGGLMGEGTSVVNSYGLSSAFISEEYNATIHYQYWPSSQGRNPTKLMEDWMNVTGYKTTSEMLKDKNMRTITPLAMRMPPPMDDDMQTIVGQIGDVVKTNSWLMVFAKDEAEFQAYYDEMVEKAEGLGIQKVLDWCNEAWKNALEEASKYTD